MEPQLYVSVNFQLSHQFLNFSPVGKLICRNNRGLDDDVADNDRNNDDDDEWKLINSALGHIQANFQSMYKSDEIVS